MKINFKISYYINMYNLFLILYLLTFKNNIDLESLKLCLSSAIIPALVGGSVINLCVNNQVKYNEN